MNMRLIDADKLMEYCSNLKEQKIDNNDIARFPTAYDIDKVVEELELHSFEFGTDTLPAHYVRLNDAIEIVKVGGKNE